MCSRKKPDPPKRGNRDLSQQLGIGNNSDDFDPTEGVKNDEKLTEITANGDVERKPKLIPTEDLDKMVAESMKDIGSDEELSDDDDDPDLLGELLEITGEPLESLPSSSPKTCTPEGKDTAQIFLPTTTINFIDIIKQRIEMYEMAEESSKKTGEEGKARRFNRGLKTLQDLLKQASSGKGINVDDIPPEVFVKNPDSTPNCPSEADGLSNSPTA